MGKQKEWNRAGQGASAATLIGLCVPQTGRMALWAPVMGNPVTCLGPAKPQDSIRKLAASISAHWVHDIKIKVHTIKNIILIFKNPPQYPVLYCCARTLPVFISKASTSDNNSYCYLFYRSWGEGPLCKPMAQPVLHTHCYPLHLLDILRSYLKLTQSPAGKLIGSHSFAI